MQVINLSCTLDKVTYKHALTHATSWQTLGFHTWNRPPVDDCIRQVNRGAHAEKTPARRLLMRTSCREGASPGDQTQVSRQACRGHAQRQELFARLVLQRGKKHAPACLTGYTNLWRLYFLPRGRRCKRERFFRSEILSQGLMVQLPTACMIVIRTIVAQDTMSSLSELI